MTVTSALTAALRKQVLLLEDDLRARIDQLPQVRAAWQDEHHAAVARERTAASWQAWRDDQVTLAAVAWVLTTVFVRFCEDNALVRPVWITGPGPRRQEALDAQLSYFRTNPEDTDREWICQAVDHLAGLPATRGLVESHSPLHLVSPSGDAASALLAFWRARSEDGPQVYDFTDPDLSTRFLGDLYQDLSQEAKDRYALLQTPEFVEEFILDRTLEPALRERPLEGFRLIDPTCGSGHFLLGAFSRFLDRWDRAVPGLEVQARVQAALDAIHGVDLNPYAVAIARFRLTLAAMKACGLRSLENAPAFRFHLAVGDSLLHGQQQLELDLGRGFDRDETLGGFTYSTEDLSQLREILQIGRYDVVVGNPPYITPKDKTLNQAYRTRFRDVCKGTYQLTAPFMQRFFQLAKSGERAGWVGQITSNAFMKREFGSPLIERFLAVQDLRLVADTSGAYIPGHGTPTVIIVGRNGRPVGDTVRAVLGVRGEPGRPQNPATGLVWTSIVDRVDEPGYDGEWVSVDDLPRDSLASHPWSLAGGGATTLQRFIEKAPLTLFQCISGKIGFASFPGADEAFFAPRPALSRGRVPPELSRAVITGESVRDWATNPIEWALVPYNTDAELVPLDSTLTWYSRQWPLKTTMGAVTGFGGQTQAMSGQPWWGWYRWVAARYRLPFSIAFAFVATHNHFVLDRGGKVFKQSAPVIKLPAGATEDNHLELLGVLNSSAACFWLKQNSYPKGGDPVGNEGARVSASGWDDRYEFTGTTLQDFPLPASLPLERGRTLDGLAQRLGAVTPEAVCAAGVPTRARLDEAHAEYDRIRAEMIAQQEELDWEVYRLYGLVEEEFTLPGDDLPGLALGERAFEIALARRVAAGEEETAWFARHGSTPITEIPARWPATYHDLVQRRLDLMAEDRNIRLLEKPEYKRRWASEPWAKLEETALRGWLLDRLEDRRFWFDPQARPAPKSVAQLADEVSRDRDLSSVLALREGRPDIPVQQSLLKLLADEAVPYLAAYRYKEPGLRKRAAWEQTWALQRREDAGERVGPVPVPPKYTSADFTRTAYWSHRGKLDVPKEHFILYPDAGRSTDPTPLLGWAGWDHAQQGLALNLIVGQREEEGWSDERLVPLVAGLAELQPWVDQWHAEIDPTYGVSLAAFLREQLNTRAAQVGRTLDQLKEWRPAPARRGRGRRPAGVGR